MDVPEVHYARRDQASIAFQKVGSGPGLLMMAGAGGTSVSWSDPSASRLFRELSRFACLVTFEQRGAGLSDPLTDGRPLTLEERVEDALAVLEASGLRRPVVMATHDGGPVALLAVTTQPQLFRGLILVNTAPRLRKAIDFPGGVDDEMADLFVEQIRSHWGSGWSMDLWAPSFADLPDGRARWARLEQGACSPSQAVLQTQQALATDARHLLELVSVPTLVLQRRDDPAIPAHNGRYLADRIEGAWLVELPGRDHMPWSGPVNDVAQAIRWFIGQDEEVVDDSRRLAAVVFTDIADSTANISRLGDIRWGAILDAHDAAAQRIAERHAGRLVKCTGDGTLSLFNGPVQAIRYALDLRQVVGELGCGMRAGVHVGEVLERDGDIAGLAVHAAARVNALAPNGHVYASRTVTDLVAGSGLEFLSTGHHFLKGLTGSWEVFDVASDDLTR